MTWLQKTHTGVTPQGTSKGDEHVQWHSPWCSHDCARTCSAFILRSVLALPDNHPPPSNSMNSTNIILSSSPSVCTVYLLKVLSQHGFSAFHLQREFPHVSLPAVFLILFLFRFPEALGRVSSIHPQKGFSLMRSTLILCTNLAPHLSCQ